MNRLEPSGDAHFLRKLIILEKRVNELCEREDDRIPSDEMEERLKQFLRQEQERSTRYIEAQIIKVKEQLKDIMSEQVQHSMEIKELKQTLSALHSPVPEKNGLHFKQPNGMIQSIDRGSVEVVRMNGQALRVPLSEPQTQNISDSYSHELAILKLQVQENSFKLKEVSQDIKKEDFLRSSLLAEHSSKIAALENNMLNEEFKKEFKTFSESSKKDMKQLRKNAQKQKNIMNEQVKKMEDMEQSLNGMDKNTKKQMENMDLCFQKYEEVTSQLDKLSFLFDSLNNQCTELSEKTTELQMDFLQLKNVYDALGCTDDNTVSKKDMISIMTTIGLRYELMKTLVTQRVEGLETLRKKLANCDRAVQQRQELSQNLQHLTACVENLQFFILTQDKTSEEKCLQHFEKNWPKSPSQFELPDLDSDHIDL